MKNEFKNESWVCSEDKDLYIRTLKKIRFNVPTEKSDLPTTTLLFVSRLIDPAVRQYFEDSSRHFQTYNLFTDVTDFFSSLEGENVSGIFNTAWLLEIIDVLSRVQFLSPLIMPLLSKPQRSHLEYRKWLRSMTTIELVDRIDFIYRTIGLTSFAKINVIVAANEDANIRFGIKFLCRALGDKEVSKLLMSKNMVIPVEYETVFGILDFKKNKFTYSFIRPIQEVNKSLLQYLERKTSWVMERIRFKDLIKTHRTYGKRTLIIGRRVLTRGQDVLNESSLIQSYDYRNDLDHKLIQMLLKKFLQSFKLAGVGALVVVENFPSHISHLVSKDNELKRLLCGNDIALACVEPETKDIYTFEGDQFIQKNLRQIN